MTVVMTREGTDAARLRGRAWMVEAACRGVTELFLDVSRERPETRLRREGQARAVCGACPVVQPCRSWARQHREYGFWGGESEEERAAAGYRVEMPVGRMTRYPKGNGVPVQARPPGRPAARAC